ncbi:MAG: hypothetical protein LBL19_06545 [Spirochaetaceae bacterium]|jgi:hypothetical protein|nr:hypothetical protein [Spirochaetaceae bacterium]
MSDMGQTREPVRGLTFEDVWALFQETDRKMQETSRIVQETAQQLKETDRIVKETARQMKETDRQMKETDRQMKETNRKMKETDRKFGEWGNRFGEVAEHLLRPNIHKRFMDLGYTFTEGWPNREFFDHDKKALTEVDYWLENNDFMMAVEIKARLRKKDVGEHILRMGILRAYFDEREDRRKLLGAVAAVVISKDMREYALERGFYLIEPSGDTVKITVPEGFTPKVW